MNSVDKGKRRANFAVDTEAMRVALESKEYKLPDATKVGAYSRLINDQIDQAIGRYKKWSDIFKEFDDDLSGLLTFSELELAIRHRLKISLEVLPEVALKALWCVLDNDDSGYVEDQEFRRFIGREEEMSINLNDHQKRQRQMALVEREMQAARTDRELQLEGFIGSVQTWRMRAELADEGHKTPTKEEMTKLAVQFSKWVAAYLPDVHQGIAWVRVFNEVGNDNSGLLTFDELKNVVRLKLKVSKQAFSDTMLKALWCALDENDADSITQLDFGRFMKLAKGLFEHKAPKQFRHTGNVGDFHAHRDNTRSTSAVEELKERSNNTFLRQEVEAAGQALPTSDEVEALSRLFNTKMEAILGTGARGWSRLFKDVDVDCSGLMTYDEFEQGIRQRLKLSLDEVSAVRLKALWCVLDGDDSGFIEQGEFQSFMQREVESTVTLDKRQQLVQQKIKKGIAAYEAYVERELHLEGFRGSVQTWKMRAELEAAGHKTPAKEGMTKLAVQFSKWVAAYLPDVHQGIAWVRVFNEVGNDNSGLLTFDELKNVVRLKLKVSKQAFSDTMLKALWCALDENDADSITQLDFGRFMKLAKGLFEHKAPKQFRHTGNVGDFHAHRDNTRSTSAVEELKERSNNTFLRQEVEAAGQALPTSDEVEALSRLFNTKMEAILGTGARGWSRLFKDVDVDCSGLMTYDEFEQGIRQRLKLSLDEVSAVRLKALWCVLDGDDSGFIEQGEFQSFMQREVESTVTLDKRQQLLQNRARNQFAQYEAYVEREKLLDRHKSTVQTWKMRAELEAAGLPPSNDDAKKDLAVVFCKWLAMHDPADVTTAWLRLFRSVDSDNVGLLTYDELQRVVRSRFGITKKEFSETQLKMLWCAIDEDDSDTVQLVEFGRFVKRARGHFTRHESSAPMPVAFRYAGEGPPTTPGGQSLRVRRLPPYTYQGDPSRWELLPQWPRGPGTPRPQTAPDAATFASKMIKEDQEVPGRKIEMVRARERINALIFKAEEETKRPWTPRGCQGQAGGGTKRWLPVVYKEFSDHNTRLRDVKENRKRLDSFVKEILDSTKSWSSRW